MQFDLDVWCGDGKSLRCWNRQSIVFDKHAHDIRLLFGRCSLLHVDLIGENQDMTLPQQQ